MAFMDDILNNARLLIKGKYTGSAITNDNDILLLLKALILDCNKTYDEYGYSWKFLPQQYTNIDCETGSFITKLQPDKNSHAVLTIRNTELELHYNDLFMIMDKPKKPRYYHNPKLDKEDLRPLSLENINTDLVPFPNVKRVYLDKVKFIFQEFGGNEDKIPLYGYISGSIYLELKDGKYILPPHYYYNSFKKHITVTLSSESKLVKDHRHYYRANPHYDPIDSNSQSFPANVLPNDLVNGMIYDILDVINKGTV